MSAAALRLALPGEWRAIDLRSDESILASARDIVADGFGRRDDLAAQRREHRQALTAAGKQAAAAGATQFHVSSRVRHGVALAATVVEYRPAVDVAATAESAGVVDGLVRSFSPVDEPDPWHAFEAAGGAVFAKPPGLVVRRTRTSAADDSGGAASHVVEYWLTVPESRRPVLLVCSTALADLAPVITDLFDAVVAAAEWADASASVPLIDQLRVRTRADGHRLRP